MRGKIRQFSTSGKWYFWAYLVLLLAGTALDCRAATDLPVFGPERYERRQGAPTVYIDTFERCEPSDLALLRVWNGESKESRITAAEIFVNDSKIFAENEFKQHIDYLEKLISVEEVNELKVVLKSGDFKVPAFLKIDVLGKNCDDTPPVITDTQPVEGALLNTSRPLIAASYSDEPRGSGIDPASVRLTVDGRDVTALADVFPNGVRYTPDEELSEGSHTVVVTVSDRAFNTATLSWTFTTDTIPPTAQITSHEDGQYLNIPIVTISGTIDDPTAAVTINGAAAVVAGGSFSLAGVALTEGANTIAFEARDPAGNAAVGEITLHLDTAPPVLTVSAPVAGAFLNTPVITVAGTVNEPVVILTVNGSPVQVNGNAFTLNDWHLTEGENHHVVYAEDRAGNAASLTVTVVLDTIAPVVAFTAPPAGLLTNNPLVDIAVTTNEPIIAAILNGAPATVDGVAFSRAGHLLKEGENVLTALVTDRAGNVGQGEVGVVLDTIPPAPPQLSPLTTPTNVAETVITGEAEEFSLVRIFVQPAAETAAVLLGVAQTDAEGRFTFPGVTLTEGTTHFTATATDAAGNESDLCVPLAVELDTVAPVITVTAPAEHALTEVLDINIVGTLSEIAALAIDGAAVSLDGLAFDHPVVLEPGENTFILLATDQAGNTGTASVTVHADNTPPTVTISAPLDGTLTRSATITVSGTVDEEGCTATLNGQPLTLNGLSFGTSYTLNEGDNALTVVAVDRAGNIGEAAVGVTLDSQPPQLSLAAPAEGTAGGNLELTLDAADSHGLYLLELRAGGIVIWSGTLDGATSALRTVGYTLSPTLSEGTSVALQARALDLAGNEASVFAQVLVTQAAVGPGYLQGEVYDDRRGLRLAGATYEILGGGGEGETTDEGGYFAELTAGAYLVRLSKPGHTAVDRPVSVRAEQNAAAFDARLTPGTGSVKVPAPLAEAMTIPVPLPDGPPIELTIPADALAEEIDLRLTPVSNQGLAGLLPTGWSPLAAIDIRALDAIQGDLLAVPPALAEAVLLSIPLPAGVETPLDPAPVLARYDESAHQWIAVSAVTIDGEGGRARTDLGGMGQYALVLPDPDPLTPTPAVIGQPLAAADGAIPDFATLTAAGRIVPPASPPLKGLIAVGEVVLTPGAAPLPSGTVVNARINERFDLTSGESVQPADYVQHIVLYRYPCVTNPRRGVAGEPAGEGSLRTTFPVSPSREYGFVDLLLGKVGVEIRPAEEGAVDGMMVGADGARLLTDEGDALEIPAGALDRTTPVALRPASAGAAGVIGDDFRLLRAIAVDLTGQTLAAPARLSIATPAGFDPAQPVVLARVIEFGGVQRLKLVGFVQASGSMLVSETVLSAPSAPSAVKALNLPGVSISGTYVFLQVKAPIGLVSGKVTAIAGTPFAGARVSAAGATLADLTGGDGRYLLALPLAPFTLRAVDPLMADRGEGSVQLQSAWQVATLDLAIQAVPPRVVALEPVDGAAGVEPSAALRIVFSEPVARTSVTEQSIVLKDSAGAAIPGVFSFSPDGTVVAFYPSVPLRSETAHTLTVGTAIRDLQGYSLAQAASSTFTVRKTTPPPMPPAGAITATFPDEEGMITVTATQGSAEADTTVLVINDTTGEIVAVVPQSNGSFTARINAQLGDEIQIVLMDAYGNQTIVTYLTFKAPDGRYLVTAKGGKVEGEGGSVLEIPEGALIGPAVVKLTIVPEEELLHEVPEITRFLGAVKIDTGGIGFQKEVKLSIPAPLPDIPAEATPFLTRPIVHVNPDGTEEELFEIVNSAKVIDGRLTTASPPFAGVVAPGTFAFLYTWPVGPVGGPVIVSGTTYRDMDGLGGYMPGVDQPIRGAVIRSPGAENFISYSDAKGHYATYGFTARDVCRNFAITAIHPQTMFRNTSNITTCDAPYIVNNLNFKLADKDTQIPDTAPPVIELGLQVAPGQGPQARIAGGAVPVGTELQVALSVIDQAMGTVFLTVVHTDDQTGSQSYSIPVGEGTSTLYRPMAGEIQALFRTTYQPRFSSPLGSGLFFQPNAPGFYTLIVEATDAAGNSVTQKRQIRAVTPGDIPPGRDGAPFVISITPGGGAADIKVDTSISAIFSEVVENVTEFTFQLIDKTLGVPVPAMVTVGVEEGIMKATLIPRGNLLFGRTYEIVIGQGITDSTPNPSADGALLPLEEEYRTDFTTMSPRAYDLVDGQFQGGWQIDVYNDITRGKVYSYITAGENGWRIADVTEADKPRIVWPAPDHRFPAGFNYRGVAVEQDRRILAITENISFSSGGHYGYVRFYDLANPAAPPRVGQEKLAEAYSGIPGRLALKGKYAYVATVNAGLQVVDVEAAIMKGNQMSDGSTIVGMFDSVGQGFGHAGDIIVYKVGSRAILATTTGYLLSLDLGIPQFPMLVSPFRPDGVFFTLGGIAADYSYEDETGAIQVVDLMVVGTREGTIRTVDFTDPANPRLFGMVRDEQGAEVITSVRDIALDNVAGLAFVSTFNSIQIVDVKDPANPRLLSTIAQLPDANGNILPIGVTNALVELNGSVYLSNQTSGLRILEMRGEFGIPYPCNDCYIGR